MLAFLTTLALCLHPPAFSSAATNCQGPVPPIANSLSVRFMESEASQVSLGDAFVWAYASLRDHHDGDPIVIDLGTTRTDVEGRVSLDLSALADLPPIDRRYCTLKVSAYRDGCFAEEWFWSDDLFDAAADGGPVVFAHSGDPGESFCVGRVVDERGKPVVGVEVRRIAWDADAGAWDEPAGCCRGESDALGFYVARSPLQSQDRFAVVDVTHGFGSIEAVPGVLPSMIVLESRGAETSGRVVDETGAPVPFALVEASAVPEAEAGYDEDAPLPTWHADVDLYADIEVRSDARGEFRLALPPGTFWWLDSGSSEGATIDEELVIVEAGTANIELPSLVPRARVFVRDEEGRLLRGVKPHVYGTPVEPRLAISETLIADGDVTWLWREGRSDADGGWSFDLRGLEGAHVRVDGPGFDEWILGGAGIALSAGRTVETTIIARRVDAAKVPRIAFLDADGIGVEGWIGRLGDTEGAPPLLHFDTGEPAQAWGWWLCFTNLSSPCWMPIGAYRFEIRAVEESYVLSARGTFDLSNEFEGVHVVHSPGFGGRLYVAARIDEKHGEPRLAERLVLTAGRDVAAEVRQHEVDLVFRDEESPDGLILRSQSILLPPGTWSYVLHGQVDSTKACGEVLIRERNETPIQIP